MQIYATFGSPLFIIPRIYVPNGNIVFHGVSLKCYEFQAWIEYEFRVRIRNFIAYSETLKKIVGAVFEKTHF